MTDPSVPFCIYIKALKQKEFLGQPRMARTLTWSMAVCVGPKHANDYYEISVHELDFGHGSQVITQDF
jgi:hypothetical protein